jgi:flagellin
MALNAQNKLTANQSKVEGSIKKLSSGLRINSAADDAAGLAISEKMRAQIRGLKQAQDNAQDGISLLQTAEGALQQTTDILQRMRELVIKAQNTGVLTDSDRTSITSELTTLRSEIDRIATSTTFNGKKLLNGSASDLKFKIGANTDAEDTISVTIADMSATGLKSGGGSAFSIAIDTAENANATLVAIDYAIGKVSEQRTNIGVLQNRMEYAISNLGTSEENLTAAESRIRDVDMAEEMVSYTKNSILNQAAMAMLAQANQQPQSILSLLQ